MIGGMVEILLVEDDPDDAELTLHALEQRNISNPVRVAADGEEALEIIFGTGAGSPALAERPRIILLDLKLPKIDGLEVLRRVRENPRTRAIPVVVMTSSREECDLIESYRLGVNSYIVKPVDFAQFVEVVSQLRLYWTVIEEPPVPARSV